MNAFFVLLALAHLALLVWLVRGGRPAMALGGGAALVAGALVYDNLVVGLGATIGEGNLLEGLNRPRYTMHVLFTPLMVVVAARLGAVGGVPWAARFAGTGALSPATVLAAVLVAVGGAIDGLWPELVAEREAGVLRYVLPDPTPPLPSIVTVVVLIAVGVALWRRGGPRWLALGSIVMFVGSAVPPGTLPVLGNLAEVALIAGVVATVHALAGRQPVAAPSVPATPTGA